MAAGETRKIQADLAAAQAAIGRWKAVAWKDSRPQSRRARHCRLDLGRS